MRPAESAGLHDLLGEHLSVGSPNPVAKSISVIAGMLAGADSIDDLDVLRHGGMRRCFAGVRAPSTLGAYLRVFTHGHVQQLNAVGGRLLAGLTARAPGLLAGADAMTFVDIDDTIRKVNGYSKQGNLRLQRSVRAERAARRPLHPARRRRAAAHGHRRLRLQCRTSARSGGRDHAPSRGERTADGARRPALSSYATIRAATRGKAWFSVTARMSP